MLVNLFEARFDPDRADEPDTTDERVESIEAELAEVSSLDQDSILRSLLVARAGDAAHQRLPHRRRRTPARRGGRQARPEADPGAAPAPSRVRGVGVLAEGGGRAPALRLGRARWPALVGSPRGLPHRDPRPGQGADGQERGHRPDRREGRLRREESARPRGRPRRVARRGRRLLPHVHQLTARRHRQLRHRRRRRAERRRAAAGAPLRRRRPVPGRRGRQGDGDLQRHRQRHRRRLRVLARRRVRQRRIGRLRPQGDGHHRAWRVGVGEVPLPRTRHRHADAGLHRRRHRRHVRRRVRQRHAALRAHPAGGRVRPPAHLPRSRPGRRDLVRRARAHVRAAALVLGRLRHVADQRRRRRVSAHAEGDPDQRAGRDCARAVARHHQADARRADPRDPRRAGRPAVERRHRHVRQGLDRVAARRRRQGERPAARRRQPAAGPRGRRGRQPRSHPARPRRVRAGRRTDQHGRDRQLGRRRHVRPRGEPEDPARQGGRCRADLGRGAQRTAAVGHRRCRGARAARQLRAERAARDGPQAQPGARVGAPARHAAARGGRPARPRDRVPADGQRDGAARGRRLRPRVSRERRHGRVREDHADAAHRVEHRAGRAVVPAHARRLFPEADRATLRIVA